jgi:eukaryotic-like serine/threonine-protein kinase
MRHRPQDVLEHRYRLLRQIGSGAHGVVFRARDLTTRADVAVKFLGETISRDPTYVERLRREARAMDQLRGTSAVKIHALGTSEQGEVYMVMEYLVGRDLEAYLRQGERQGGQIKPDYLATFMRPIVHTLSLAHGQGIVHRDLKPSNVFVLDKSVGRGVRLLDFGLVKIMNQAAITNQGEVAGTPSYIAPETWKGDSSKLDHRIDVYALGVMIFRMLGGRVPYKSQGMLDMLEWALKAERPSLHALRPDLDARIDGWVKKALAIDPDQRYPDVVSLWSDAELVLGTTPKAPF